MIDNIVIKLSPYQFETINNLLSDYKAVEGAFIDEVLYHRDYHDVADKLYDISLDVYNHSQGPYLVITLKDMDTKLFETTTEAIRDNIFPDAQLFLHNKEFEIQLGLEEPPKTIDLDIEPQEPDRKKYWQVDRLTCKKCGNTELQFNWKFESENHLFAACMCHRGFGLMLDSAEITCPKCGERGYFTDDNNFTAIKVRKHKLTS